MTTNRRDFIKKAALGAAGLGLATALPEYLFAAAEKDLFFKFAISQFSFASEFWTKQLDPLDFAAKSKELGISGLDYCSMFFADKAKDTAFLNELKKIPQKIEGIIKWKTFKPLPVQQAFFA